MRRTQGPFVLGTTIFALTAKCECLALCSIDQSNKSLLSIAIADSIDSNLFLVSMKNEQINDNLISDTQPSIIV